MHVARATVELFARLRLQPTQAAYASLLDDKEYVDALVNEGAWACVDSERVLGIGGFVDQGGGRAHAWAMLTPHIEKSFLPLHRATQRIIDEQPFRRIEMVTPFHFRPASRWASALGFDCEATVRSWFPDGSDGQLWAKVRPWLCR